MDRTLVSFNSYTSVFRLLYRRIKYLVNGVSLLIKRQISSFVSSTISNRGRTLYTLVKGFCLMTKWSLDPRSL